MCRHVALALQVDGSAQWNGTGVLATHVVVPQGRFCDIGRDVRRANDEVVSTICCRDQQSEVGFRIPVSDIIRKGLQKAA